MQPAADAVKLFTKEISWVAAGNKRGFLVAPRLALLLALSLRVLLPWAGRRLVWQVSRLGVLVVLRLNVYPLLVRG